jgi:hypothetical protein
MHYLQMNRPFLDEVAKNRAKDDSYPERKFVGNGFEEVDALIAFSSY